MQAIKYLVLISFLLSFGAIYANVSPESYATWIHRFDIAIEALLVDTAYYNYVLIEGAYNYDKDMPGTLEKITHTLAQKGLLHDMQDFGPDFLQKLKNQLTETANQPLEKPSALKKSSPPPAVPQEFRKEGIKNGNRTPQEKEGQYSSPPPTSPESTEKNKEETQFETKDFFMRKRSSTPPPAAHKFARETFTMSEPVLRPFATHGLLIFLNDSKEEPIKDPVAYQCMCALGEKAFPIAVSYNILLAVFEALFTIEKNSAIIKKVTHEYNQAMLKLNNSVPGNTQLSKVEMERITASVNLAGQLSSDLASDLGLTTILIRMMDFKPEEWIIKYIDHPSFVLLIPRNYKNFYSYTSPDKPLKSTDPLTRTELEVGLKIDHMQSTSSKNFIEKLRKQASLGKLQMNASEYFIRSFHKLFITCKEYTQYKIPYGKIPRWIFYMLGHGSLDYSIANLPIYQFDNFLHTVDRDLLTQLFVYISCFAVGTNLNRIFLESTGKIKRHSFAIATEGIADTSVSVNLKFHAWRNGFKVSDIDFINKKILMGPRFNKLLKEITETGDIDYTKLLSTVLPTSGSINSIVLLRFPGLEWFKLIDFNDHVITIDPFLSKVQEKPLSVRTYFAKKRKSSSSILEGILVETSVIPFDLIIDVPSIPKIISMLPGDALHHFNKITIRAPLNYADIIKAFYESQPESEKIFLIDTLEFLAQDFRLPNGTTKEISTLKNVIIQTQFVSNTQIIRIFCAIGPNDYMMDKAGNVKYPIDKKSVEGEIKRLSALQKDQEQAVLGIGMLKTVHKAQAAKFKAAQQEVRALIARIKDEVEKELALKNPDFKAIEEQLTELENHKKQNFLVKLIDNTLKELRGKIKAARK